jgi:hypothetical protein
MNIFSLTFLALMVLKLCGAITVSWLIICVPLVFWAVLIAIPSAIVIILIIIFGLTKK